MNEPISPAPNRESQPKRNRRINFGRRRSDWMIPLVFLVLTMMAVLWALNNRIQREDAEQLNEGLRIQTELRERQLRNYEKQIATPQPKQ